MHDPVQLRAVAPDRDSQGVDLVLMGDIADVNRGVADELSQTVATGFAANGVHDVGPGLAEHPGDLKGDALLVGDAHHKNRFAGKLEEIHAGGEELSTEMGIVNCQ